MNNFMLKLDGRGPLYQQLARAIQALIDQGQLQAGDRLPTVRALFQQTGLSDGTIRHAYELLARDGVLTLTQGKGTFVSGQPSRSRENQAMQAIDQMIESLTALGMSAREIQMYVNVKLSRQQEGNYLPVAVVDCNSEALNEAALQLSAFPGVELTEYLLGDVRRAPRQLLDGFSLIVTTQSHYPELSALLGDKAPAVLCAVAAPSPDTLVQLARIPAHSRIALYCRSARFGRIMAEGLALAGLNPAVAQTLLAGESDHLGDFLSRADVLITSPDYLTYASPRQQAALSGFAARGAKLIPFHYQLDQGSLSQIARRIQALREGNA